MTDFSVSYYEKDGNEWIYAGTGWENDQVSETLADLYNLCTTEQYFKQSKERGACPALTFAGHIFYYIAVGILKKDTGGTQKKREQIFLFPL